VVVGLFGALLPFVNGSPSPFGSNEVFRGQMLGQHSMRLGICSKQRETPTIAHRHSQASIHERLPPIGVEHHVADGSLSMDVGDSPVQTNAIAGASFILAEWHARGSDESTVAGHDHSGVFRLSAELVNDLGQLPPVCIDIPPMVDGSLIAKKKT